MSHDDVDLANAFMHHQQQQHLDFDATSQPEQKPDIHHQQSENFTVHHVIKPPPFRPLPQRQRSTSSSRAGNSAGPAQPSAPTTSASGSLEATLERIKKGLEHIVASGGIDGRASRQTPLTPKSPSHSEVVQAAGRPKQSAVRILFALDAKQQTANANILVPQVFAKRGRKRAMTPNMILLESFQKDIEATLNQLQRGGRAPSGASPNARSSLSPPIMPSDDVEDQEPEAKNLESVIESPLAILAHISSLKISESTEEESGDTQSVMPGSKADPTPSERYFATGELVAYFARLHPFSWHLTQDIHASHAMFLSDRVFSEGFKTVEIVQAYILLIHFAPIENNWGDDKRWGWLGMATRIATEIRLDKILTGSTYQFYRTVTPLRDNMFADLAKDRAKTWMLLQVVEIALCVSTGRLGAVKGLNLVNGFRSFVPHCNPSDPQYDLCAMEDLHKIYAKAIALSSGLKEEGSGDDGTLRESYNAAWMNELHEWKRRWPSAGDYVKIVSQHATTILLSISLRFKGSLRPILEDCKKSATETLKIVRSWPDDSIEFGSNLLVVNLAYAATLLIRIMSTTGILTEVEQETRDLCRVAADVLARMGQRRPTIRTLAALHATRIRHLLETTNSKIAMQGLKEPSSTSSLLGSNSKSLNDPLAPFHPTIAATTVAIANAQQMAHQQQQPHQLQHQQLQQFRNTNAVSMAGQPVSMYLPSVGLYPNAPMMPPQLDSMWDMFRIGGADPLTSGAMSSPSELHSVLGVHVLSPSQLARGGMNGHNPASSTMSSDGNRDGQGAPSPQSPDNLNDPTAWMMQAGAEGQQWRASEPGTWAW
ncbi:hypothetical protein OIO90_003612 [Microbotryomycetes sp. JL221]|nr:hypothetical protein OIO90_003612 [Microbotryomycetes sp. JL221]